MTAGDRRAGDRVPLQMFLNQYLRDRLFRGMTSNISASGLYLETVRAARRRQPEMHRPIGLEFELPGTGEVIWARGEVCYRREDRYTLGYGIRFAAMARVHAKLIRDFCGQQRSA